MDSLNCLATKTAGPLERYALDRLLDLDCSPVRFARLSRALEVHVGKGLYKEKTRGNWDKTAFHCDWNTQVWVFPVNPTADTVRRAPETAGPLTTPAFFDTKFDCAKHLRSIVYLVLFGNDNMSCMGICGAGNQEMATRSFLQQDPERTPPHERLVLTRDTLVLFNSTQH